jgi:ABC-2 type transport system ATP-binding protein
MIKLEKIQKSFGETKVLKNVSLTFEKGKVYGIVGENGAGKSTLFRCIAGLESYDGFIDYSEGILKNHLGYLETNPSVLSKITGLEHLKLFCQARNITTKGLKDKNAFELPLEKYVSTYSTGMKKKLALTAILLQKNDIFILDEPYNGIDIQSNLLLNKIIHKLKDNGKIVILSSHIFSTLQETCDRLFYLKEGEIKQTLEKGEFKNLEEEMKANIKETFLENLWN